MKRFFIAKFQSAADNTLYALCYYDGEIVDILGKSDFYNKLFKGKDIKLRKYEVIDLIDSYQEAQDNYPELFI